MVADTDLNVVSLGETGIRIKPLPLEERRADSVEGLFFRDLTSLVEESNHSTIQFAIHEIGSACVSRHRFIAGF